MLPAIRPTPFLFILSLAYAMMSTKSVSGKWVASFVRRPSLGLRFERIQKFLLFLDKEWRPLRMDKDVVVFYPL